MSQIKLITDMNSELFYHYFNKRHPIIISEGLEWSALSKWSPDYFLQTFPNKLVNLAVFNHDKSKHYPEIISDLTMENAVNKICNNTNSKLKHYLMQQSIPDHYQELMGDINIPDWAFQDKQYLINLWFGEEGNKTPLHFDASHNFLVQVYGKKLIYLFPPTESDYLYPNPYETKKFFHLSQVEDIVKPDLTRFPEFKHANPLVLPLNPGQILFIPSGWWHHVISIDLSISVNFFWQATPSECDIKHLLRSRARLLYEENQLHELHREFDLTTFTSTFDFVDYLNKNGCRWLSLFIIGDKMRKYLQNTYQADNSAIQNNQVATEDLLSLNQLVMQADKSKGIEESLIRSLFNNIEMAKSENDDILSDTEVDRITNRLKQWLITENEMQ